jgi:protein TonB
VLFGRTFITRRFLPVFLASSLSVSAFAFAGEDGRKVKTKVTPIYPEMAKRMNISGAVRLEIVVGQNGSVKSVKALGGHPLLVDAAMNAVKQWKYESGDESTQVVEIRFTQAQ